MDYETIRTRNGEYSVRVQGKHLHSAYAPVREAVRLREKFRLERNVRVVVVIGEGIPYFSRELAGSFLSLRVIALTFGESPDITERYGTPIERISLDSPTVSDVRRLLRSRLSPVEAMQIQAYLWPVAQECIPDWANTVKKGVLAAVRDGHSELATTASFGKLWIRNAIRRNLVLKERYLANINADTVVALSGGPSVTESLSAIFRYRRGFALLGVSSVAEAASHSGVIPDILVHTDAGFWAKRYHRDLPTVISFRATPPVHPKERPEILFRSGWIGEELALDAQDWPTLGEQPSVAATMLAFADRAVPEGVPFFLSGFDLVSRDLITHARPHPNDRFVHNSSNRLTPEVTIRAERSGMLSDPEPLVWHDGTHAFRTEALKAFQEPLTTLIRSIGKGRPVRHMSNTPIWCVPDDAPGIAQELTVPGKPAVLELQCIRRPSRSERKRHMEATFKRWTDSVVSPDDTASAESLLMHLAPVEMLSALRGDCPPDRAVTTARRTIEDFRRWIQHD